MLETSNTSLSTSQERVDDGQRRLRRIARAGKHWKNTIGRPVDMEGEFPRCSASSNERLACHQGTESRPSINALILLLQHTYIAWHWSGLEFGQMTEKQ